MFSLLKALINAPDVYLIFEVLGVDKYEAVYMKYHFEKRKNFE